MSHQSETRKYPHLSTNFLKGSLAGQIRSLHRDKGTKLDKLAEFQQALKNRDIPTQGVQLTPQVRAKAVELGITLRGNTAKLAKVIQLLEDSRRDNPLIRSRVDQEAEAMAQPADPQSVLDAN